MKESENERNLIVREESDHILDAYRDLEDKFMEMGTELEEERSSATKYYEGFRRQSD